MNKNICIIGGAYDPITLAHRAIAEKIADAFSDMEIWFIIAYKHFFGKNMSELTHRKNMCKLGLEGLPVKISDYQDNGSTFDLMQVIKADHPDKNFYFVIGQDNAENLHLWDHGEELIKGDLVNFIVIPRQGSTNEQTWYKNPPHQCLSDIDILGISSTQVRAYLKSGNPEVANLVSPKVLEYIKTNGLYQ